jgi:hypothetical protein
VKDKINEVETGGKNMNTKDCIEALMILRWVTNPRTYSVKDVKDISIQISMIFRVGGRINSATY